MTFKQFMAETGYDLKTTFWDDFSIADRFGMDAVQDTFNRAFKEWKHNHIFLTELVMVLNHKIWQHYETNEPLARLYDKLWKQADQYACENLKGDELKPDAKSVNNWVYELASQLWVCAKPLPDGANNEYILIYDPYI